MRRNIYLTCTRRQRQNLLTPPSQHGKPREETSVKESLKNIVSKNDSKKSTKGSIKDSEKSKSSKSRRGEPRETLVSTKKMSKETPKSSEKDSSIRTAGRNSLQTEPPTLNSQDSIQPVLPPIQQRTIRSNRSLRLPTYPLMLPSENNNNNNQQQPSSTSTRVTRSSIRNSLIESNLIPSEPRVTVLPQNAAPHSVEKTQSTTENKKNKKKSSGSKSSKSESAQVFKGKDQKPIKQKKIVKEESSPWEKLITKGKANEKDSASTARKKTSKKSKGSKKSKSSKSSSRMKNLWSKPKNLEKN
uniref:Uncharacterized protein n=1 Tax=Panagrolaimus sp. PS1159 TaxID=55785 RepID=A0AC35FE01_9BILA